MVNLDYRKVPDGEKTDPKKEAGFFSLLTFWWMNGVFQTGAQRPLEESDFLPLQKEDETQRLTEKIQKLWNLEKNKCAESGNQPRLWKCVLMAVSLRQLALILFTSLMDSTCRVLQPLLLGFLVSELISVHSDRSFMFICAAAMFVNAVIKSLSMYQCVYLSVAIGMRLMAAVKGVVYLKVSVFCILFVLPLLPSNKLQSHIHSTNTNTNTNIPEQQNRLSAVDDHAQPCTVNLCAKRARADVRCRCYSCRCRCSSGAKPITNFASIYP